MTGERKSNTGKNEPVKPGEGGLVIKRLPGEDIIILSEKGQLIIVKIESMEQEGPKFSIETAGDFRQTTEEDKTIITDESGRRISIAIQAVSVNSQTTSVYIKAPREYKIHRGEFIQRERDKERK